MRVGWNGCGACQKQSWATRCGTVTITDDHPRLSGSRLRGGQLPNPVQLRAVTLFPACSGGMVLKRGNFVKRSRWLHHSQTLLQQFLLFLPFFALCFPDLRSTQSLTDSSFSLLAELVFLPSFSVGLSTPCDSYFNFKKVGSIPFLFQDDSTHVYVDAIWPFDIATSRRAYDVENTRAVWKSHVG